MASRTDSSHGARSASESGTPALILAGFAHELRADAYRLSTS
uniref:Uncharacterized protein n=1 Tax=Zea mays TaxID=4577 RepID=B6TZ06_MAIZE|nr:hypothetical protein [Zea mays]